ncbi:MAG: hypothetical protein ACKO3W_15885, partial [bacterium]
MRRRAFVLALRAARRSLMVSLLACVPVMLAAVVPPGDGGAAPPRAPEPAVMPAPSAVAPVDFPGIHNLVAYGDGLVSGSAPEGDEGLDSLAKLGFKTIISVDGAI